MKILSEREQKLIKIGEISSLRTDVFTEINKVTRLRDAEAAKTSGLFRSGPNPQVLKQLDDKLASMYKVAETLLEYRDSIEDTLRDSPFKK